MRLLHHRLTIANVSISIAMLTAFLAASTAWGHGFGVYQNSYNPPPTAFGVLSEQPVLDNFYPPPGQGGPPNATLAPSNWNVFTDAFGSTPMVGNGGATYYETEEGFVALTSNPYNSSIGAYGIQSATFKILSPLYYSDGTESAAVPASDGTYLEFSINPDYSASSNGGSPSNDLAEGGPDIEISGDTSVVTGFPVSGSIYHELLKDLYIAPTSAQTYGEYGYAFDVTYTLNVPPPFGGGTITLTTPPMVDVFGLTDPNLDQSESNPNGGDFADNAPIGQQDLATTQIYEAAIAAVPEPSSLLLGGIGLVACAFVAWRKRSAMQASSSCAPSEMARSCS